MAAPAKKRDIENESENDDQISSDNDSDNEIIDKPWEEIVDFMGRTPEDCDFHGIKILLQQLFLKAHVNLSGLADYIISHNYVGSVVKQELCDEDDDDDDDDGNDNVNDVFGITSVINLSGAQNEECIRQLRALLKDLSTNHASNSVNEMIQNILGNDSAALGLIINERFINIPAQISIPLLENLVEDMKKATNKKMPYEFQYFILISKLYKANSENKLAKKGGLEEPEVSWSNQEEEVFDEEALYKFEFPVEKDSDTAISGSWKKDDDPMIPYRRIIIFEASKLQSIISKISTLITSK